MYGNSAVAPGSIGQIASDDGMMQRPPFAWFPRKFFAACAPHTGQPPLTRERRSRWIRHIDHGEDVIGKTFDMR